MNITTISIWPGAGKGASPRQIYFCSGVRKEKVEHSFVHYCFCFMLAWTCERICLVFINLPVKPSSFQKKLIAEATYCSSSLFCAHLIISMFLDQSLKQSNFTYSLFHPTTNSTTFQYLQMLVPMKNYYCITPVHICHLIYLCISVHTKEY